MGTCRKIAENRAAWPGSGIIILLFLLFPLPGRAQTALEMDLVLESPAVSWGQAARFVLGAAAKLPPALSGAEAELFAFAAARDRLPKNVQPGDRARLGGLSWLVMETFGFEGGLLYRLFPGPRYAYRELLARRIIQGTADPALAVSGERLLAMLARILDQAGDRYAAPESPEAATGRMAPGSFRLRRGGGGA